VEGNFFFTPIYFFFEKNYENPIGKRGNEDKIRLLLKYQGYFFNRMNMRLLIV